MTTLPVPISDLNLPKASSSSSTMGSGSKTSTATATSTSTSTTKRPQQPRLPQRPSFGRRQRFNMTYTQLASHMAVAQAQPHKPKRPSPLHVSVSPESFDSDSDLSSTSASSSSSDGSNSEAGLDVSGKVLSPITEERDNGLLGNMLGLDLKGRSWSCERQERMKEPRTPFPSPAVMI